LSLLAIINLLLLLSVLNFGKLLVLFKNMNRAIEPGWVYVIKCEDFHKIGKANFVQDRIKNLQTATPFSLRVKFKKFVSDCGYWEKRLHQIFREKRQRGEWFSLDKADLQFIDFLFTSQEMLDTFGASNEKLGVIIRGFYFCFTPTVCDFGELKGELRPKQIFRILKKVQLENSNWKEKDIEFAEIQLKK